MPILGTLASSSLGTFGLAQQAQIAILKASTAIPATGTADSTGTADWSNITLEHTLDNPNPFGTSENDQFGMAVAMSSTHAIIGAEFEDDADGTTSGKAYIFDVTTGSLLYTLDNPNPNGTSLDDKFAHMVAISNTYAMVGAFQEDEITDGINSGKVYIYDLADGSLIKTLNNRDPNGNPFSDLFGFSVAISNTHAIVGAWAEDSGASASGAAYIYNISSDGLFSQPIIIANPTAAGSAYFGWSVALSDNYAIVSAPNENDANGSYSGKAHIFNLSDGSLVYTLDNPNAYGTSGADGIGSMGIYHSPSQVTINDSYAVVGAPWEDDADGDNSGKVYVFDMSDGSLAYTLDNPNAFGTSEGDHFGLSVAIDGDILIVGAPYEDDDVSNNYPGKAYIFDLTDGSLVNTIDDPNAFGTSENDRFGHAVAISDGRALVSASREDDGTGTSANSSGKAYIFSASAPAEESTGWSVDLSNVTYDSVSFGVNQDNDPMSIAFNNDGTKMYMMGSFHRNIHQYTLSTGFDLSTASYDNVSFYVGSQDNSPMRLKFNTDGTKMYINGLQRNKVHQYSLGSGFDLSTASYDNVAFEIPEWNYGFTFNNDGTKMYSSSNALRQYSLSAGFDISTATYDNVNFDLSSQSHSAVDTYFNSDGTKMYILFAGGEDDVHQYTLTTGFDISTASYDNVMFSVGGEETNPTAICISIDGTKMYMVGASNDTVYQYSTGV
jgi:hypothetical protein